MRRRELDGCPVTGALQMVGDRWTLLVVRDLARGARRTTELLTALHPISSRTLVMRLRDMESDRLIERRDRGGSPPHVEYILTERGRLLMPLLDCLQKLGEALDCHTCDDRKQRTGDYCHTCPRTVHERMEATDSSEARPSSRRNADDSIVLL